jgi:hypothetical protein
LKPENNLLLLMAVVMPRMISFLQVADMEELDEL